MELIQTPMKNYGMKVHIFDAHLVNFKQSMQAYSEEQAKRFHQDILNSEHHYQEQYKRTLWETALGADLQYKRKSKKLLISKSF